MAFSEYLVEVTVSSGASLSESINLGSTRLSAIMMPADWTAADLTFQASPNSGGTYHNLYDEADAEVVVQAAEDRYIILSPDVWSGVRNLKIRSGTSGTPVNQAADRAITLVCVAED